MMRVPLMPSRLAALAIGAAMLVLPAAAPADVPLVADLSSREIAITTGFAGTELLLFGATDGAGDVVVVVRGPPRREVVHRKMRVAGIWLNGDSVTFDEVPGFYFVAASRPLEQIAPAGLLERLQIGVARLHMPTVRPPASGTPDEFRTGLIRAMQNRDLYSEGLESVIVLENRLFRTEIEFPANVPTGVYTAEAYMFRDGQVAGEAKSTVIVRKAGVEARIHDFAHEQAALYGIVAIIIALVAGWLAGVAFRKA